MTDLNTPERVNRTELDVPPRSAGTALPMFPPKPEDTVRGPLIVSALPAELPRSLRAAATPIPVAVPLPTGLDAAPDEAATPRPAPPRRRPLWIAGAVVALVVAVVVALLLSGGDEPAPVATVPSAPAGEYEFRRLAETDEPIRDSDCTPHAYGHTKDFLVANRCLQLTRAVYSTVLPDGRTVHTSVSVVRMRTEWAAGELTRLVREEGTGSVTDLLRDNVVVVPGLDRLSRGGFAATQSGRDVVIVESDTTDRDPDVELHKAAMKRVSLDAVRLGAELR